MVKIKYILTILIFSIKIGLAFSQSVIASGVNYSKNNEGSIAIAIGEFVSETIQGENVILTQGFYQSKLLTTQIDKIIAPEINVTVYPNPIKDVLKLQCNLPDGLNYELFNLNGTSLINGIIQANEMNISFHHMPAGTYLLAVKKENQMIEHFKVVKQ
jgi:hypothetical protein